MLTNKLVERNALAPVNAADTSIPSDSTNVKKRRKTTSSKQQKQGGKKKGKAPEESVMMDQDDRVADAETLLLFAHSPVSPPDQQPKQPTSNQQSDAKNDQPAKLPSQQGADYFATQTSTATLIKRPLLGSVTNRYHVPADGEHVLYKELDPQRHVQRYERLFRTVVA